MIWKSKGISELHPSTVLIMGEYEVWFHTNLQLSAFPVVNFLFKCFGETRCFHDRECHLVILQSLEYFHCSPEYTHTHIFRRHICENTS